ncbi:SU10 major capsid protein [Sphingomonas desiccabilis]|uniref:Head protein n=1 Tax=Sphingomonas desiccabilis TaxID=429134 RepID=A0A4Q2IW68_9SPHN|nr:DUF5309 family protein [Sphingomonas desiccabilis]MBB3910166.1 hypothetical protein [Sphingomonas desiccabilis]RXZ34845.1 hypothetical protein EO081_04075 [Sphingomonas desiccabilis]
MATFKTYDSVGAKEDVSDVISMLNKHETPFTSSLTNRTVGQKTYEWQEDEQEGGQDNAQVEGFDAVEEDLTTTEMRSNTTQIFSRTIRLSGSVEATEHYGRKSELARQLVKKGKALKLDRERACVGVDQVAVLGSSTTPRRHASAFQLIDAGNKIENAATAAPLAETTLRSAIRKNYDEGGKARRFMVAPYVAEQTAEFAGNASRTREITGKNAKEIVHVVDVYTTALGTLSIETNREMKRDYGLLWNPEDWKNVTLKGRGWFRETLAKTGDNTKIMLAGEYGLQHNNFKASTLVTNIGE